MRRFILQRHRDVTGVSGVGRVAEGVRFSDGRCALRWRLAIAAGAFYDSLEDLTAIHGHDGATEIVFLDPEERCLHEDLMTNCYVQVYQDAGKLDAGQRRKDDPQTLVYKGPAFVSGPKGSTERMAAVERVFELKLLLQSRKDLRSADRVELSAHVMEGGYSVASVEPSSLGGDWTLLLQRR